MRVLVTGVFDLLHPGHIFLLEEAAKLGEVFVIVARDSTVEKWKKRAPAVPENQRLAVIRAIRYVSHATLGNENNNFLRKALSLKPDIILLGPNQRIEVSALKAKLEEAGAEHVEVKRQLSFFKEYPLTSSTQIKEKIITRHRDSSDQEELSTIDFE